jgi:excisionase family DNA binding protein
MSALPEVEVLLTVAEVAAILRVPKAFVYARTTDGSLPHYRYGERLIRISSVDLAAFQERCRRGGESS